MVDRIICCEFLLLYCKLTKSSIIFSHSANWSADAHLCGSGYALLSDERASILNLILCQRHLSVSLIRLQPDGTYVIPKYYDPTQYANL